MCNGGASWRQTPFARCSKELCYHLLCIRSLEQNVVELLKSLCVYLQPRGEDLLQLIENECSSTTYSTEVNVSEEEVGDKNPQSNDQVVPIDLEECRDEPKVVDPECLVQDPEGNDICISQNLEGDNYYHGYICLSMQLCFTQIKDLQEGKNVDGAVIY